MLCLLLLFFFIQIFDTNIILAHDFRIRFALDYDKERELEQVINSTN
jgi:hypothetical protein